MTTPKKYTSVTRIGVTAEFEAYTWTLQPSISLAFDPSLIG